MRNHILFPVVETTGYVYFISEQKRISGSLCNLWQTKINLIHIICGQKTKPLNLIHVFVISYVVYRNED
jgi:hypothetical protein